MRRMLIVAMLLTASLVLLSGLGVSAAALGGATAATSRAVVKVAYNKRLDTSILVDGSGRTLYMFTEDHGAAKLCTPRGPWGAACPAIWPPLTGRGKPQAGQGINSALFGVTKRSDGKSQITYNRHPLYYFHGGSGAPAGDKKPGDINGQGFASEWYVLSPKGAPIRKL